MIERTLDLICVECPRGCRLRVERDAEGAVSVRGQACPRGEDYGRRELLSPSRTLTGTVRTVSSSMPRLSVRSSAPLPRDRLLAAARSLAAVLARPPLLPGDLVAKDFAGLGIDLLATDELPLERAR